MGSDSPAGGAIVFPGMGPTPFAEVGKFMLTNPCARRLVAAADDVLGYSLVDRYRDSDEAYSESAQVAFMVNCLALAEWAGEEFGIAPEYCAGPSFGAKASTAYVQSLPFADAVMMTAEFARCLAGYFADEHRDIVTHSFIRTPADLLHEVLSEMDERGNWYDIACYLDRDFYMVSLHEGDLEWLQQRVRSIGGLSLYTMRPPMHSKLFGALRRKAEEEVLGKLRFADPTVPVVSDHDGSLLRSGEQIRTLVLDGIVRPLRWPEVVATLRGLDVTKVMIAGPDGLFGRVGCTTDNFEVMRLTPRLALQPRRRPDARAGR
ncbi:ACP S-malonyltransferase [Actinomadura sp. 7K507]|uniref:ACP S-malonyltransferase n=1 Tax=Actinomadura sp. 7K507 TaxID=2530365 RepID=UPI001A9FD9CA|nr:ACP S-malonyltransferase [Actinomadura sp. 7K507]